VGRTLYVTTLRGTYAFDAATCKLHWRHVIDFKQTIAAAASRGPGYLEGRIFRGTAGGRVIALDAQTGQLLWDVQGANPNINEGFNSAPIAWQGKVFIGIAVSDNRIAGRLMAFDAQTGRELWRFDTTLGAEAGGGFWTTYSLDPKTGEVFGGVAIPYPDFNRDLEKNDHIYTVYTNSVISVNAMNTPEARLNWSYQAVPRHEHDWDLATALTLYRTPAGKDMLAIAGKSGRVYGIDRATRALAFNTPATTVAHDDEPLDQTWKLVCPGIQGGTLFNGTAYHPGTGVLYVGMSDHCAFYTKNVDIKLHGGAVKKDFSKQPMGWITAMDGETGEVLWKYQAESQVQAGLVPTKSGLLFAGDTHGNLLALDAKSGSVLKRIDVKGALNSGLISYGVDGEQYVAATVGGPTENPSTVAGPLRVSIFGLQGRDTPTVVTLERLPPDIPGAPAYTAMFVQVCGVCHGVTGAGGSAPPLIRQS
jgi:alcohol dehydrogenase (cytochrome c)